MFKRKALFGAVAGLALSVMGLVALPISAQDAATPTPFPTATPVPAFELGSGGTHITF